MEKVELKNKKSIDLRAAIIFIGAALVALFFLLPAIQDFIILIAEKITGRELRGHEKWHRVMTISSISLLISNVIIAASFFNEKIFIPPIYENEKFRNSCSGFFIVLVAFIFSSSQSPIVPWNTGIPGTDSSVFQYIASAMQKGLLPYRDAFDHKGTLIYIINYLGTKIDPLYGVWFFDLICILITFLLIYKIARLSGGRLVSIITLLISTIPMFIFFEGGNLTEEFVMPFITGAVFIFIDYFLNGKISRLRLVLCGLSFGAVCMLRTNMIAVWIVWCIAVLIDCIRKNESRKIVNFLIFFLIGFAVVVVPICFWHYTNGTLKDFIDSYIIFNLKYASSPVGHLVTNDRIYSFVLFGKNIYVLSTIVTSILLIAKKERFFHVAYLFSLLCSLFLLCIPGKPYDHYGMSLIPLLAYPFSKIEKLCLQIIFRRKKIISSILLSTYLFVNISNIWLDATVQTLKTFQTNSYDEYTVVTKYFCQVIKSNTHPEDKISVYGNWNIIYVMSDRLSISKYSYQFPIGQVETKIMDKYFYDLEKSLPKIIVIHDTHNDTLIQNFIKANNYKQIPLSDLEKQSISTKAEIWLHEK